jgi:hypothetical protein
LVEESILVDLDRTRGRRTLENGMTVDFSPLREFGLTIAFWSRPDGGTQFVDFLFVDG